MFLENGGEKSPIFTSCLVVVGQENQTILNSWTNIYKHNLHLTTAPYDQYNTQNNPQPKQTRISLLLGCNVVPVPLKRLDCHLTGFDGQGIFGPDGGQHSSSAHLSTLSTSLQFFIHLFIHPFIEPFSHMCTHLSWPLQSLCSHVDALNKRPLC